VSGGDFVRFLDCIRAGVLSGYGDDEMERGLETGEIGRVDLPEKALNRSLFTGQEQANF